MEQAYDYCADLVRQNDRDRFIAGLFAPAAVRPHLYALYAFNYEIGRIRETVSDALPGEIRLQWWHDAIGGTEHGDVRSNPVAAGLLDTIEQFELSREVLHTMIEARTFDFYDDPMPTLGDLESYASETAAALIALGAHVLGHGCDADIIDVAAESGMAKGMTDILVALPYHASRRQLYLPGDLLETAGVDPESVFLGRTTPELVGVLGEVRAKARRHLEATRSDIGCVPSAVAPAFLEVSLVEWYLRQLEKPGYDPFRTRVALSPFRRQWILWRAAVACRRRTC